MARKNYTKKYSVSVDSDMTGENEGDRRYRAVTSEDAAFMAALDYINDAIQNGMNAPTRLEINAVNALQVQMTIDAGDEFESYDPEHIVLTVRETD